jgi:hypothetical protein
VPSKEDLKKIRYLNHPVRKRIIELLGSRGSMSFTEMRSEMNLPVGTLYYHLDVLKGYVLQDEERRYYLSKDGRKLYDMLSSGASSSFKFEPTRTIFIPSGFFPAVERNFIAAVSCIISISVVGGALSYFSGHALIIEHYGISIFSSLVDVILFPASIITYMLYTFIVGRVFSGRRVSLSGILTSSIVYTPTLIPLAAAIILHNMPENIFKIAYLILTVIAQVASTIFGATYLSSIYGMRFERSLLIQIIFYIISTIVFSFLQTLNLVTEI